MTITNVLAGIAVSDATSAIRWYEQLLNRPPDTRPMAGVAEWEFEGGGWIQVFMDANRAGRSSATLVVADVLEEIRSLRNKGITVGSPTTTDFAKTAVASDPDGNQLVLAQAVKPKNRAAS